MTAQQMGDLEQRRRAYKGAFERWSSEVRRWKALAADRNPGDPALDGASNEVDEAQAAYHESRDRLAEYLLGSGSPDPAEIRVQAHALWEAAGRPVGNPDEHWYRAEAMLRSRRAAAG